LSRQVIGMIIELWVIHYDPAIMELSTMLRILLVDDDMSFRRSLMIQLELEEYCVTEKESAERALEFLAQQDKAGQFPDMVITDVKMDGMGGEAFVAHLEELYPALPVMVISAYELPSVLKGYPSLKKPFKIERMKKIVQEISGQKGKEGRNCADK